MRCRYARPERSVKAMTVVGIAQGTDTGAAVPARPLMLLIAAAGIAAAAICVALALTSDHQASPEVQGALMAWITLSYVFAGLVAWWRRPHNHLGPLMIAAGFGVFLASLTSSNHGAPVHDRGRVRSRRGGAVPARLPGVPERPDRAVGARPGRGRLRHRGRGAARRHGPRRVRARQPAGARVEGGHGIHAAARAAARAQRHPAGRNRLPRRAAPALGRAAAPVAGVARPTRSRSRC